MRDLLGEGTVVGYCTNVHSGESWEQARDNLRRYAGAVKALVCPRQDMGVGLWLSARCARELIERGRIGELVEFLDASGLLAFTLNGFPYGNFHEGAVKHRVYQPDWRSDERVRYTLDLIEILRRLLPEGAEGSISTLPLGWKAELSSPQDVAHAARNLHAVAQFLEKSEQESGRLIHLDLEPEPGCVLGDGEALISFFTEYLSPSDDPVVRRHVRVCHDICHSAVMFENQAAVLARYSAAGIDVGKVQVSSALRVPFPSLDGLTRREAWEQLKHFQEDRYLHQTVIQAADGSAPAFFDDLKDAIAAHTSDADLDGEWRVHFHVPIFHERIGWLRTTSDQILPCVAAALRLTHVRHFELETYAWQVLPAALRSDSLAAGIAQELDWFLKRAAAQCCP